MPFPNPEGKIKVLKRYLHILALLQYIPQGNNPETWNAGKLAELLYDEDHDENLEDDHIRKYIKTHIIDALGLTVNKKQGGLISSIPAGTLSKDLQLELARVYTNFVVKDTTRDVILKRFIDAMPERALWTLARIYFAIIQKRRIHISYTTNTGYLMNDKELCPYYLIFRSNSLYLVVWDPIQQKHMPLLAERIENLTVIDHAANKEWDIIPVDVLYKESLSAYITEYPSTKVTIKYKKNVKNTIEGIISWLDPAIQTDEKGKYSEATFNITDYLYLCKQFVIYGSDVEIISPPEVRKAMISMLKTSLSVYEKQ